MIFFMLFNYDHDLVSCYLITTMILFLQWKKRWIRVHGVRLILRSIEYADDSFFCEPILEEKILRKFLYVERTFGPFHPDPSRTLIPPGCDPIWYPAPTQKVQKTN